MALFFSAMFQHQVCVTPSLYDYSLKRFFFPFNLALVPKEAKVLSQPSVQGLCLGLVRGILYMSGRVGGGGQP